MPLTEQQALDLTDGFDLITDQAQKQKATALLHEYRTSQEENGLPPFPSLLRDAEEESNNFRSMFTDLKSVDALHPQIVPVVNNSPDPEADRMRFANVKFISRYTGKPEDEALNGYDALMPLVAHKMFGKEVSDDKAFYAEASAHIQREQKMEKLGEDAQSKALLAASDISMTANKALAEWKASNPEATEEQTTKFLSTYNDVSAKLPSYGWVGKKTTMQAVDSFVKGTATQEDADHLLDMPAKQRNLMIAAMFARAGEEGKKVPEGEFNATVPGQTGKSFVRTLSDMLSTKGATDDVIEQARTSMLNSQVAVGEIKTPEDARKAINEQINKLTGQRLISESTQGSPGALGVTMLMQGGETRKLTAEEKKLVSAELDRQKRGVQLSRTLTQIERTADPVKSALASGLGSSAALMGIIALPGGAAFSAVGYANSEYDKLKLENPGMSDTAARAISGASGVVQAGLDKLEFNFIADKLPSVRSLINNGVASSVIKRGVLRAGETFAFEQVQEGLQDATTPLVQGLASALSKDVPQVDWQREWAEWSGGRADVAIGTLPLTLIGMGVAGHNDIKDSHAQLRDVNLMRQLGVQDTDIVKVSEAKTDDDKVAALQDAFTRRDPEVAKAAGASAEKVTQIEADKRLQTLVETGVMPKFTRNAEGWTVETPDGSVHKAQTWDEARSIATQHFADAQNQDIDAVGQLADHFLSQDTGITESVSVSPESRTTADDVAEGVITEQQARDNAITAGMLYGLSKEQAVEQMGAVLGRNLVDTQNLVAQSASQLWKGGNVLTLTEEVVEGRWKAWVSDPTKGAARMEETRRWIAAAEQATGMKFLHNDNVTEAVSAIVTADVLGSRKDGTRVPAGAITKGVSAAIQKSASNSKFASFLQAWRTFFKQVFQRARALSKAKAEGKLDAGHQQFVDRLLGVDQQTQHMNAVAEEVTTMMSDEEALKQVIADEKTKAEARASSYSLAPRAFHAAVDSELEKFLRDPEKRAAYFAAARLRSAKVQFTLRDVSAHMAKVAGKETEMQSTIAERQALHESRVEQLKALKKVEAPVDIAITDGVDYTEITQEAEDIKAIKAERDLTIGGMKTDGASAEDIAKAKGEFDVRIEQAKKLEASQREADFKSDMQDAETEHMRWLKEAELDHEAELAVLAENLQMQLETYPKGGWGDLRERNKKLIEKEKQRWADEKASIEATRALEVQAAQLKFDGKQKASEKKRNAAIDKQIEREKARWALEKQRIEFKHQIAVEKLNSNEALNKQRSDLYAVAKVLDAIVMAFPAEVRGKVGGFSPMVKLNTNAAMLKHLQAKLAKLDDAMEAHLKDYYTGKIKSLVGSAIKADKTGEAPKSKTGASTHEVLKAVAAAIKMDEKEVAEELARLEKRAEEADTQEELDQANRLYQFVSLTGNLDNATAATAAAAHDALTRLYATGRVDWKLAQDELHAPRVRRAEALLAAAQKRGEPNAEKRGKKTFSFFGVGLSDISSFYELMKYTFGDIAEVREIVDNVRRASYEDEDNRHLLTRGVDDILKRIAGDGDSDQLNYDLQQPTIKLSKPIATGEGPKTMVSNNEAIDFILSWSQADGKARMEAHGFTQEFADEVHSKMSSEALQLMNFISEGYAAEWAEINPSYEKYYGVSLPRIPGYAELSAEGDRVGFRSDVIGPKGEKVRKNVSQPGFFSTRTGGKKARPMFQDALAKFLAHRKQAIYWKAFFEVAQEVQSLTNSQAMRDALNNVIGHEGVNSLRIFQTQFAQNGIMDAAVTLEMTHGFNKLIGNAQSAAILGRFSTIMMQTTQIGAALVHMPAAAYAKRVGKLMSGQLNWMDTVKSEFIQRRIRTMPPLVRAAMEGLGAGSPAYFRHAVEKMGEVLGFSDAFFTAATYAMVKDYQMEQGAAAGLTGAELEQWATNETERAVEETAQPILPFSRSSWELATKDNPTGKIVWPFATNSRMMASLLLHAMRESKADPGRLARASFFAFVISGIMPQILKNGWRDLRGDDDERKWTPQRLLLSSLSSMATGIPLVGAFLDEGNIFSGPSRSVGAVNRLMAGEWGFDAQTAGDVEKILQAVSFIHPDAAAVSAMSHLPTDLIKIIDNILENK